MARRRMLNIDLILDDDFTQELSLEAQNMYIYLNMLADDDGIVGHLKRQLRMLNKSSDSVNELIKHGYLLEYDSQTLVITDWLVNNHIRGDRYTVSREDDCRNSLYITYDWQFTLNNKEPKAFIKYAQWITDKRTVNGKTIDKISREELKQLAKASHTTTKEQAQNINGNQSVTNRVPSGYQMVPPVSGTVPVSESVPVSGAVSGIGSVSGSVLDPDRVPTTQQRSSNGGMGEILLTANGSTSTKYNNATTENGANSGEENGVDQDAESNFKADPERIQEITSLFDSLNQAFNTNLSFDDERLRMLFDNLLNQYKIGFIENGLVELSESAGSQNKGSVKSLVVNHLSDAIKHSLAL